VVDMYVPAVQLAQDDAPNALLKEPAPQGIHSEEAMAPTVALKKPALHAKHEAKLVDPNAALYLPAGQLLQLAAPTKV